MLAMSRQKGMVWLLSLYKDCGLSSPELVKGSSLEDEDIGVPEGTEATDAELLSNHCSPHLSSLSYLLANTHSHCLSKGVFGSLDTGPMSCKQAVLR